MAEFTKGAKVYTHLIKGQRILLEAPKLKCTEKKCCRAVERHTD